MWAVFYKKTTKILFSNLLSLLPHQKREFTVSLDHKPRVLPLALCRRWGGTRGDQIISKRRLKKVNPLNLNRCTFHV